MSASALASVYHGFDQDPTKYLNSTAYGRAALSRLPDRKRHLFDSDKGVHKVPIRNISASGTVDKKNLLGDGAIRAYLGDIPSQASNITSATGSAVPREDAKCRFIHLCAAHTIGPLELDAKMLLRLLTFYQVMPQFLDFLYVYSSPHAEDRELRFSGFRTEKTLMNPNPNTIIPELGRSGRRYQICLNLKTVINKGDDDWKIRQAVIHHQFDVGHGTQLWMIGDPHAALKKRIGEDLYPERKSYPNNFSTMPQGFSSSLDVMLDLAEWSAAEWRWHILFLEKRAEELTTPARIRERSQIETIKPASLGDAQKWEEKTNDTIMAMESNVSIMRLLQQFYKDLARDANFPSKERRGCQTAVKNFSFRIEELICETQMQIMRAKVLVKLVADRKTIIIQHLQTHSAITSSKLAATMFDQADRSEMEAIFVRIVTVVTMIYLPATFSSTFFSTDVVKYQDEKKEVFSEIALMRFLQVTLPLMLLTFVTTGIWFWVEMRKRAAESQRIKAEQADAFPDTTEKQ